MDASYFSKRSSPFVLAFSREEIKSIIDELSPLKGFASPFLVKVCDELVHIYNIVVKDNFGEDT